MSPFSIYYSISRDPAAGITGTIGPVYLFAFRH
jgi:hypothetical protein